MIVSAGQIMRRLAVLNVRVGDVQFDTHSGQVDIIARADNRIAGTFSRALACRALACSIEDLIGDAAEYFHGLEHEVDPIEIDGKKVPA